MASNIEEQLTLFAGGSLASHSASPGSEQAREMTVISGLRCFELFGRFSRVSSLARTLVGSSAWNSTIAYLTWKSSATPAGRLLFRLVPLTHDIDGIGSGFLATATATANQLAPSMMKHPGCRNLWGDLDTGRVFISTPDASVRGPSAKTLEEQKAGHKTITLQNYVKFLPTPTTQDASNNGGPSQHNRNSAPLNAVAGGSLNPRWVEWLMGFPEGWTDLEL